MATELVQLHQQPLLQLQTLEVMDQVELETTTDHLQMQELSQKERSAAAVKLDPQALLVNLALTELQEKTERAEKQDNLDKMLLHLTSQLRVSESALLDLQDPLDLPATRDPRVIQENKESQAPTASQDRKETKANKAQLDRPDYQAETATRELQANTFQALLHQARQEELEKWVHLDHLDLPEAKESLANRDQLDSKVIKEIQDLTASLALLVLKALLETLVHKEDATIVQNQGHLQDIKICVFFLLLKVSRNPA